VAALELLQLVVGIIVRARTAPEENEGIGVELHCYQATGM
jgi:hypothetical protein